MMRIYLDYNLNTMRSAFIMLLRLLELMISMKTYTNRIALDSMLTKEHTINRIILIYQNNVYSRMILLTYTSCDRLK